ncbi:MAG: hypothetical protein R2847_04790 [Bacteroidia bacterium]
MYTVAAMPSNTTKLAFGITANGITKHRNMITTPPYGVSGGIPFTGRPDSITGWYKYTPQGANSGVYSVNADRIIHYRHHRFCKS